MSASSAPWLDQTSNHISAARNMAWQGIFAKAGKIDHVVDVSGADLIGTLVHAPLSVHTGGIRVLPMDSILPTKGTGTVSFLSR